MAADLSSQSLEEMTPIAGINVTPFVDVVLVLLVIFMITAPVIMKETIGLNLPKATSGTKKTPSSLGFSITRNGQIFINGNLKTPESITAEVKQAVQANPDVQAMLSADVEVKHGDIVHVIDLIRSAGLTHFAIQVEKPQ